ncbi:thiamine pyrophosphate-dependent acetolactate synthase large subunit-like protein [Mesorhizobium sp. J18]|uniref:thiamine pyrophosphate-binding protein n=1 Tax=Mesorhizobium sp. J18 TaxID=935263 RepID=UPI001199CA3D|nr:thiamine pyrophosphate-binding protein [Mesorhizobium sp. J18]TWG96387.1 thiamine pyrophosphate-dependent acetolactate synthase large subunit-like protein [Mesorhizobium sp. J18]
MKVYEAVVSALISEGVTNVFGLMGDGNISIWGAMGRTPELTIYSARNEAGAVAMADGYYRGGGAVGVATITCGPGLTQVGTSLMAAARNRSPIVVIIGEIPPGDKNGLQMMDQRRFAEASGARYHTVTEPDNAADEISEAFYAARAHRCPVVLNVPIDIGEKSLEWDWDYRPSTDYLPAAPGAASEPLIAELVHQLVEAERPIIVAGQGAKMSGARDAIMRLADRTGALLATSLQGKGIFEGHEYDIGIAGSYASAAGEELFGMADFVLGVGAEVGYYTSEAGLLFPSAKVARVDINARPDQMGVTPGLYLQGDARLTIERVCALLEERQVQKEGFRTDETREIIAAPREPHPIATDGLDPRVLMEKLSQALPSDAIVTCGAGHFLGFGAMNLAVPPGADIQFSVQFGAVGQTMPVAIGIGVANPGRPHVVIEGDGSLMMNVQEVETAARHRVPMVLVVWNDCGFGAEVHKLNAKGFKPELAQWTSPDFVLLARAFGGDGVRLEREDRIGDALRAGLAAGGLYVIDARVSPTEISDAYQKIHFGRPNKAPILRYSKA